MRTKTLPATPGWYQAMFFGELENEIVLVEEFCDRLVASRAGFSETYELEEFEWGGDVPTPGTVFTVEEWKAWMEWWSDTDEEIDIIDDPVKGIAAMTNRKE